MRWLVRQSVAWLAVIAVGALLIAVVGVSSAEPAHSALASTESQSAECEVTTPQFTDAPGGTVYESHYVVQDGLYLPAGEHATYAAVPREDQHAPSGTYPLQIKRDGKMKGKVPWFRESHAYGDLRVKLSRRPGRARGRGIYSNHLGPEAKVVPGALMFPRTGCWRIRASSGDARFEAIVEVIKVE